MKVFIGWDARDDLAFRAAVSSLRKFSTVPLEIYPIKDYEMRRMGLFTRPYKVEPSGQMIDLVDGRPFSTQFSFTRFLAPILGSNEECILFMDADMLCRKDIAGLFSLFDPSKEIMCVHHSHDPIEKTKMDGVLQSRYHRKNWSSLMLLNPAKIKLKIEEISTASGKWLHSLEFAESIGALPEEWNWLEGHSSMEIDPSIVHYTRGTPDMLGDYLPYSSEWWQAVSEWRPSMNRHEVGIMRSLEAREL